MIGGILPYCLGKSYSHPIALQGKFPEIPKVAAGDFLHQKNKNITTRHKMVFRLTGQVKVNEMSSTAAVPLCQYLHDFDLIDHFVGYGRTILIVGSAF